MSSNMDNGNFNGIGRGRGRGRALNGISSVKPSFDDEKNFNGNVSIEKLSLNEDKENFSESVREFRNKVMPIENGDIQMGIPKVSYIPDDNAEDYQLHVNSGINFDNYDNIQVHVTGKNIPESISSIDDFQIPEFLKSNIMNSDYKKLTPVQKYTIPMIANGRDLMACAQTGSGKTVAFLVPIIKNISENPDTNYSGKNSPKCLIVVPTRELCRQIYTVAFRLCKDSQVKCSYSYGGVEMRTSMMKLYKCDILVSTPGRLVANIESSAISLDKIRYLVLDEADRLLQNESFMEAIKLIFDKSKSVGVEKFHVSMFSATFPSEMQQLGESYMSEYLFVAVGLVGAANSDIKQTVIRVSSNEKLNASLEYLANNKTGKTLIFVQAKRFADFLGIRLIDQNFTATTIHGDRDQKARESALNDFKSGRVSFLVATDVASRGLDIPLVDTVINIDMPEDMDVYVHRIGRTGRCGNIGLSVSFFDEEKDIALAPRFVKILKDAGQECPNWLETLCSGYRHSEHNRNRRDYRKNVESSTFVENKFIHADDDDFF